MKLIESASIFLPSAHAASSPSFLIFFVKVVTNAVESAPSANRSRSMLGVRKAAVKTPVKCAPNIPFSSWSRTSPSSRLHRMAMETMPVLLAWEEASFFGSLMREGQCFTAARRSLSIIAMPMPCSNIGSAMISSTPSLSSSRST